MSKRTGLPRDDEAERGLIGCLLLGADADVDPAALFDERRRKIVVTIQHHRANGWIPPASDHPRDVQAAARSNLERIVHAIDQTWQDEAAGCRSELQQSLDTATRVEDADYFGRLVIETHARRQAIAIHERRLKAAQRGELSEALEGTDLTGLAPSTNGKAAVLRSLADIAPERIAWLWPGRIPAGKLTIIAGDPGLGKSLLTVDLAARISSGSNWPDGTENVEAGGVVILSAEDDPADTIRPRLDAADADVSRINLLQGVERYDRENKRKTQRPVSLQRDLDALEEAIGQTADCKLVIIDPINAYVGGGVDTHKDAELRTVLTPLCDLAAKTGAAIVAVSHLNKGSNSPAIQRTMGSMAFVAAARSVWLVIRDPKEASGPRRLLLPVKANLGPDTGGLSCDVRTCPCGQPILAWSADPVCESADELLSFREDRRTSKPTPALDEAKDWLREALADGPQPSKELFAEAKDCGISKVTLKRAKSELGIRAEKGGFDGGWMWSLDEDRETVIPFAPP
jgi:putative DNA primase/helicase